MDRYFVYCLINKNILVYVGSTTKIINRIKTHKKDKEFDEVIYCELPDKKTMLEVEAYGINSKRPPLNRSIPNPNLKCLPSNLKWKRADLNFLRYQDVDWDRNLEMEAYWNYYLFAMEELNIPSEFFQSSLRLKITDGKIIAVFDGTGVPLIEFIQQQGYNEYTVYRDEYCNTYGKISIDVYEKSICQFGK